MSNNQKLREAVETVIEVGYPHNFQRENPNIRGYCYDITKAIKKCFDALAEPPRNCDVGDAKEQAERFFNFCDGYMHATGYKSCGKCPLWTSGTIGKHCELKWAQMPYEEGDKL